MPDPTPIRIETPAQLREARLKLGFQNQDELAKALRLKGKHAWRTVSAWETGERAIPGPVAVAIELMVEKVEKDR